MKLINKPRWKLILKINLYPLNKKLFGFTKDYFNNIVFYYLPKMDSIKSFEEKIKIDNDLSNRYIDLDPNGYFIIKVDLQENKIILEHFLNNINDEGYAIDPETNEPIKCDSQDKRVSNEVFEGISAKQLGILITEERNDLITRFDHALYLGRELQKAEECLYKKLPYIQD